MKGSMGGKEAQDAYVEAILLLPGVTSVTVDAVSTTSLCFVAPICIQLYVHNTHSPQRKEKVVVYTADVDSVKPRLAGAIRGVRTRFGLVSDKSGGEALGPSAAANAYYGDEDEDEAYTANKKNTITDNAGIETVEQRMARKRRARAAAKGAENAGGGIMGAVANVGSWLWG
jgi:hypothetical protein